jgi:hypothetical protein
MRLDIPTRELVARIRAALASASEDTTREAPRDWQVEDYRARLLMVSALLVAPVTDKNIHEARQLIAPLYDDALAAVKAKRAATPRASSSPEAEASDV